MTDFEYDCYRKKSIAHSAIRRKCGSKSKKCSLPSDRISNKQWNERCGDVVSYQLGKPMTWKEFGKLPKDIKEEYLNSLIVKYSANARNMADLFDVSVATIFRVVKNEGLNVRFQKGRHPTGFEAEQFQKFLTGSLDDVQEQQTNQDENAIESFHEVEQDQESMEVAEKEQTGTRLDSFTMNFSGEIDVDMVANSLRYILGKGRKAKILLSCEIEPA